MASNVTKTKNNISQSIPSKPKYAWIEGETATTSKRKPEQIRAMFVHPTNIVYLQTVLGKLLPAGKLRKYATDNVTQSVMEFRAIELLESDPLALRGKSRAGIDRWAEVARLNRAYLRDRVKFLQENATLIEKSGQKGYSLQNQTSGENEPYHYKMFVADSLYPPGLENLNSTGPAYELREDQIEYDQDAEAFEIGSDDAWDEGSATRTHEEAVSEYWGEGKIGTKESMTASNKKSYGDTFSWGKKWEENGGKRFMRYETIPFWQKGGRGGYDTNIDETLGTAGRETGNHVRRWDMDKVREKHGQNYRWYGAR